MIKVIKINDTVYENIKAKIDIVNDKKNNKKEIWNIPTDLDELRKCTIDTINWLIGQKVKKAIGKEQAKLSASNSKAIVLLAKLIATLNPDTDKLTDTEKENYELMLKFAENGYSDSQLLNNTLKAISENIIKYTPLIIQAQNTKNIDELIKILEDIEK